jgi:hypothetical protein
MNIDLDKPLSPEEAELLRQKLAAHYRDQVLTVKEFCSIFREWSKVAGVFIAEMLGHRRRLGESELRPEPFDAEGIFLAASKSDLLGRMIYGREKLRTKPCPTHQGTWSGCFIDCECGGCGWLPEDK